MVCATSKASDQPAHTRSLIRAFASRLNIIRVLRQKLTTIMTETYYYFRVQFPFDKLLLCRSFLSTSIDMLKHSVRLLTHCFQFKYLEFHSNKQTSWAVHSTVSWLFSEVSKSSWYIICPFKFFFLTYGMSVRHDVYVWVNQCFVLVMEYIRGSGAQVYIS